MVHTVTIFSFLTVPLGLDLNWLSFAYINSREFPGHNEYPPGPIGYYEVLSASAAGATFSIMFPLNQWLTDGLLVGQIPNPVALGV